MGKSPFKIVMAKLLQAILAQPSQLNNILTGYVKFSNPSKP